MTPFRYSGPARITHLNTRKEGPDDEKHLAIDLKLSIAVHADVITQHIDDQARDFLWTDIGAMRNLSLGPLQYGYQLENYTLDCLGSYFGGVKVKRFQVEPKDGLFAEVVFSVSFDPTGNEVARLAEYLQDEFPISLQPSQEDLPGLSDTGRVATRVIAAAASARRGFLKSVEASGGTVIFGGRGEDGPDPLYDEACGLVTKEGKASAAVIQGSLRIGYNRAARLLDHMERAGIVKAAAGGTYKVTQKESAA